MVTSLKVGVSGRKVGKVMGFILRHQQTQPGNAGEVWNT